MEPRSCLRSPSGNQLVAFYHCRPHPWPLARCRSVPCFFFGRFSRVFCHWRVVAARPGNGDGLPARSRLCRCQSRGVCEGHVS
ncbi:hypothetical protein O9993_05610 [Vibrio lentus]|nr:hypothetical protein [Vibrio lentus]